MGIVRKDSVLAACPGICCVWTCHGLWSLPLANAEQMIWGEYCKGLGRGAGSRGYRSGGEKGWLTMEPPLLSESWRVRPRAAWRDERRGLPAERGREPRSWWLSIKGSLCNLTTAPILADHILSLKTLPEVVLYMLLDSLCVSLLWITLVLEARMCRELPSFIIGDNWEQYG